MPFIRNGQLEIGIDSEGMIAALRDLAKAAPGVRRRAGRRGGEAIVGEAQVVSPVDTGTLRESHTVDPSDPDNVRIGANTVYAAAVHERHRTKARWFYGAIVTHGPRIMRAALTEALEQAANRLARRDSSGRFKKGSSSGGGA